MKTYLTEFTAIEISSGQPILYAGINICAKSFEDAEEYAKEYHPYLKVIGEAIVTFNYNLN